MIISLYSLYLRSLSLTLTLIMLSNTRSAEVDMRAVVMQEG